MNGITNGDFHANIATKGDLPTIFLLCQLPFLRGEIEGFDHHG